MLIRRATVLVGLVLILVLVNWSIAKKEALLRDGTLMLIELAPVDPRSLIQGDYMRLEYRIARDIPDINNWPRDGHIVVTAGADNVAQFVRRHDEGTPLATGEHLLVYRRRGGWRIKLGTDAFFFQEGHASRYEGAKYGELRVDASGESVLIGLRDAERRPLGAEQRLP